MRLPSRELALAWLAEAAEKNPGPWVTHSQHAATAAEAIAEAHPRLDANTAWIFALLHDVGRREGVHHMRHTLDGYRFLCAQGYPSVARICITHSFPIPLVGAAAGKWDCPPEDIALVQAMLDSGPYSDYDRLVQICDALALPTGPCIIEERLVDVALRYGVNHLAIDKWRTLLNIRRQFECEIGKSLYAIVPGTLEHLVARFGGPPLGSISHSMGEEV